MKENKFCSRKSVRKSLNWAVDKKEDFMKKILTVLIASFFAISAFALDLGSIQGTWQDENYNADWTFSADGKIVLKDSNGDEVFTFTDSNITNFKPEVSKDGAGFSFYCKETGRSYKFIKPVTLSTDLSMSIERDWTDEAYDISIKLKK